MSLSKQTAAARVLHPLINKWKNHLTSRVLLSDVVADVPVTALQLVGPEVKELLKRLDVVKQDLEQQMFKERESIDSEMKAASLRFLEAMFGRPLAQHGRPPLYPIMTVTGQLLVEIKEVTRISFHNDALYSFGIAYVKPGRRPSKETGDITWRNERFILDEDLPF